jgi:putative flippase GtrA
MASQAAGLHSRVRALLPEISKFCLIGGIGTVIDLGGAALLHGKFHMEPLVAKAIAVTASTTFTYLGSRFWTFRHREKQPLRREAVLFFGLNIVGLLIAEAVIAVVTYVLGRHSSVDYNVASFIGSGLGTVFRFYAYHKWVFAEPAAAADPAVTPARPDHPHWELDHAYLAAEVEALNRKAS